jgi:hypothetical protein
LHYLDQAEHQVRLIQAFLDENRHRAPILNALRIRTSRAVMRLIEARKAMRNGGCSK